MRRIDDLESDELKDRLTDWLTIEAASQSLDEYQAVAGFYCGSSVFMTDWREAFRAIQFARLQYATKVKLVREYRPDFCLLIEGSIASCELVEVMDPDKLRGKELNRLADLENAGIDLPTENYDPGKLLVWLRDVFKRNLNNKVGKGYREDTILAVYVEGAVLPSMRDEVNYIIGSEVRACPHGFKEIWVLVDRELLIF